MLYLKNLNFAAGIPLEIGFVGIYRWFWYLFKLAIYLFVYKPIKPRCHPELFPEKDVTIIVPTIDHGKEIEMALMTWLACQPAKIIIVTVEASRQPLELIARRCDPQSQVVRVITVPKANKRLQMIAGINETKTNIIVFCDDDVLWPSTLLTWILAPFENPRVGGVGTSQVAIPLGKRFTIWEILAAYRISIRNVEICATTAIDGGVCCLSGRTAAYRSKILKDSKFQHQFANEFWVKKYHQHSGDDKFLTRWLHSHYWDTWIQACPQVEIKSTFKDNYKFLLQLLRWTRNSWRSDLKSIFFERQIWRRNPFTAYTMIDKFFNPITLLVGPVTVFYYAFHPANIGPNYSVETVIGTYVGWLLLSRAIKYLPHFVRRPQDIIAIPVWLVFSWYFAIMKIYCLFTLRVTDWGTRAGADDKNIPSRRPTTDNYMDLSRPTELEEITVPGVSTSEASNSSTSSTWGRSTPSTFRGSQSTILPLLVCSLLCFCAVPVSEAATLQKTSFYTSNALVQGNYQQMVNNRNYINSNQYNKQVVFTLSKLRKECDKTLQSSNETTYSVTLKTKLPASNDSKDYYSLARYYFPDTSKPVPNDLPYVDLDPEVNPDIYTIQDHALFGNLTKNVKILSLGYFYLNTLAYATETARAIRQWFIDPKYSLNPNLNYAQVRTNRNDNFSESNGLLDFGLSMHQVFDALILIQDSSAWTEDDDIQLSVWMENYMDWLTTSDIGTSASETLRNNHLTYHAIHLASIGGYLGNTTLMELPSLDSASSNFSVYYLIDTQISDNGSMPYEILRHHAYHYQLFDLSALLLLSQYIISVGKSVPFSYIGSTGFPAQSITGSINYLFPPTYNPESGWPHSIQAISVEIPKFARLLYTAHSLDLEKYPKSNWALEQQNVYPPTPSMYNSSLVSIHSYIQISKALGVNLAATHDIQLLWYDITPYAVEIVWLSVAGDVIISIIGVFMAVGVVALACGIMINFRRKLEYQRVVAEKDKRCGCGAKK